MIDIKGEDRMNLIGTMFGRSVAVAALAVGILVASAGAASAAKGQGYPCTSGWPTKYQCERFDGYQGTTQLWKDSEGFCFLTASDVNGPTQGTYVTDASGYWSLNALGTGIYASAICVSYKNYTSAAKVTGTASGEATSKKQIGPSGSGATTNGYFCGLGGYLHNIDDNLDPTYMAAFSSPPNILSYQPTNKVANLYEWAYNSQRDEKSWSECLKLPPYTGTNYWGTTSYSSRKSGQTVFLYNFNDSTSEQVITDLPALNSFCMFTGVYAANLEPVQISLDVYDDTGTWAVYIHAGQPGQAGSGRAQVACIINNGP
jgi:hypothetical protein